MSEQIHPIGYVTAPGVLRGTCCTGDEVNSFLLPNSIGNCRSSEIGAKRT